MADPIATPAPQQTGQESALSNYVGPYVTEMLGRGQALGSMGYQNYGGPLSAGASTGQDAAFQGIAGINLPTQQTCARCRQVDTSRCVWWVTPSYYGL